MIFTGYCIFTDFLHVHGGLIKPSDRKFSHTHDARKKTEKHIPLSVTLQGTLARGQGQT